MKKIIWLVVLLAALVPQAALAENLIQNPGFEAVSGDTPADWQRDMWTHDAGVSDLSVDSGAHAGSFCAKVENLSDNDARFAQTVDVEPNAIYRITCYVKAEGVGDEENGAGISIKDTFASSELLYDTQGEWVPVELYGVTGPDQTSLTVMARLGGYGSTNTGTAWFDDFDMEKITAAPAGATVNTFTPIEAKNDNQDVDFSAGDTPEKGPYTTALILIEALSVLLIALGALAAGRGALEKLSQPALKRLLWLALAAGLLVRAVVAVTVYGYGVDMGDFAAWGARMTVTGPAGFYSADVFCDYPPGYMYVLWVIGALRNLFQLGYDSRLFWLLLKLPAILMDLAAAYLIYREGRKPLGERIAVLLGVLYALLPATILNSAAWGQIDSFLAILLALTLIELIKGKYEWSLALYGLAIMVKPLALVFAPLGVAVLAVEIWKSPEKGKTALRVLRALGLMLALMLLIALPFLTALPDALLLKTSQASNVPGLLKPLFWLVANAPDFLKPLFWLMTLFTGTVQTYSSLTVNAANLYYILGFNWTALSSEPGWTVLANGMMYLSFAYAIYLYAAGKRRDRLMLVCGTLTTLLFAFAPMMHERYLFPAILLLILAYAKDQDIRILISILLVSACQFMNAGLVLQSQHLIDGEKLTNITVAVENLAAAALVAWTSFDICIRDKVLAPTRTYLSEDGRRMLLDPMVNPVADGLLRPKEWKLGMKKLDWILMLSLTAIYSVVALTNLGSTLAPQTAWKSSAGGEQITFDLGSLKEFHMTYYGGICDTAFTVQLSEDGDVWSEPHLAEYNQGDVFRWLWYVPGKLGDDGTYEKIEDDHPTQTARYVRISAERAGLILNEVAFLDADGKPYPISSVYAAGAKTDAASDPTLLIDEQDTVPPYPSYLNGTYFDEIYHARTAFENKEGLHTYEYTHPPLGKLLIMVGINIFGMTPFGWRFMGALFGILMIPAIYLLARQLLRRTSPAILAAFLMSVDAMHFTQSRIATIDVFPVFFIIVMYLFMLRYVMMSFNHTRLWRTIVPLGFCGLFMGFAIASKWIGIYAAAGLAFLFFYSIHLRAREYRFAKAALKQLDGEQKRIAQRAVAKFWHNLWVTLLWCVVFFIVIPLVIYYFSYYWQLTPDGTFSIKGVWEMQKSMYAYHTSLTGDTHFFRSPWYEWPLIIKPMWYFSGTEYMPDGWISSISCMGNPAVWWGGLAALLFVMVRLFSMAVGGGSRTNSLAWVARKVGGNFTSSGVDKRYLFVVVGFLSQYLPWTLIQRSTFIYHYFASVPFIILAVAVFSEWLRRTHHPVYIRAVWIYGAAALILFVMFYPLESGLPTLRAYANLLRWFHWYNF
jgi:Gpi18-like mannosyltransferase